jgi:hypothetical protein
MVIKNTKELNAKCGAYEIGFDIKTGQRIK